MAELNPTWDEFKEFNTFVQKHEEQLEKIGFLLVNPPTEWLSMMNHELDNSLQEIKFIPQKKLFKANEDKTGFGENTASTTVGEEQTVLEFKTKHTANVPLDGEGPVSVYNVTHWEAESGLDIHFNLFPENLKVWNLNNLGDFMSTTVLGESVSCSQRNEKEMPGITSPLLFVGAYGSICPLQTERHNLHYISYLHEGHPVEWTVFPCSEKHKIDLLYPKLVPDQTCEFNELERHRVGFIQPFGLLAVGLEKLVFMQRAKQFVILSPAAYFQNYSTGYSIASSVAFGSKDWMLHVPECTICPGHSRDDTADMGANSEESPSVLDSTTSGQGDQYTFEEEEVLKPRRGRPRDPKKLENPTARPTKMCPECRSVQEKNFDRHLNNHFDVSTKDGRIQKKKAKDEAARRTVQGIREGNAELLPEAIRSLIRKDPTLRFGFRQFLDDVGVICPNEAAAVVKEEQKKRKHSEELEEDEENELDDETDSGSTTVEKSARKRLSELGYPDLDQTKSLIIALCRYAEEDHQKSTQIQNSLCQIKRILGYVDFMTEKKDKHGWNLLLETDKIKEYIQIVSKIGGATASTAKNYVDKIITVMRLVSSTFFDECGMPSDPHEHRKYMDNLKKAINEMTDFCHRKVVERDRDLAIKKAALGESLPDIASWEEYILCEENLEKFNDYLEELEAASDKDMQELGENPDKSHLRDAFNFVVEFTATRQLFLAARPGELSKCTFTEVTMAKSFRDALHINVANHKTGRIKQATIAIEKKDQATFLRYVAILKRFKTPPAYGFPFLSPTRGFVEHTKIYRRMNVWLEKNGKERFTCTKLRKTVETAVDLYGTAQDKELVGSGLNHSQNTVKQHYRVQTSEKSAAEIAAIRRSAAESKLRSLFQKRPVQFNVNIHEGPLTQDQLTIWARAEMNVEDLVARDELYSVYITNWRMAAKPLMIDECKTALENGTTMTEVEVVLSAPAFEGIKADILVELKKIQQLTMLQPRIVMEKSADI